MRSFRPQDFIQLPPLGEAGTLTLVEELEAAAHRAGKVGPGIRTALARVLEATQGLKQHIRVRERSGSAADPKARAADRALDDAWGAFQSWLLGWTRLPDRAHPRVLQARRLYAGLFPKGLQFLTFEFKDEWAESQDRIQQMTTERSDLLIGELGGSAFLAEIMRAHRAYGDALQITGNATTAEPDALVRRSLAETHLLLREYIAQVAATVRRNDPASVETAADLLAPVSVRSYGDDVTLVSGPPDHVRDGWSSATGGDPEA